ncbi:hypothetical protein HE1_01024 [Holospora elegans E1]|uniref:Uncharacterized protein n=1 Tax=Holospora elegans E1 TaxID=1427503 RepID=A0A023DYV2_9PROT|nr:hypothetical protein [Holospora elegans]GAJ46686.1 hypothetical protein HE1_01024 [Holospora elegans E1]
MIKKINKNLLLFLITLISSQQGYAPPKVNPSSQRGYAPPPKAFSQRGYAPPPKAFSQRGYAPPPKIQDQDDFSIFSMTEQKSQSLDDCSRPNTENFNTLLANAKKAVSSVEENDAEYLSDTLRRLDFISKNTSIANNYYCEIKDACIEDFKKFSKDSIKSYLDLKEKLTNVSKSLVELKLGIKETYISKKLQSKFLKMIEPIVGNKLGDLREKEYSKFFNINIPTNNFIKELFDGNFSYSTRDDFRAYLLKSDAGNRTLRINQSNIVVDFDKIIAQENFRKNWGHSFSSDTTDPFFTFYSTFMTTLNSLNTINLDSSSKLRYHPAFNILKKTKFVRHDVRVLRNFLNELEISKKSASDKKIIDGKVTDLMMSFVKDFGTLITDTENMIVRKLSTKKNSIKQVLEIYKSIFQSISPSFELDKYHSELKSNMNAKLPPLQNGISQVQAISEDFKVGEDVDDSDPVSMTSEAEQNVQVSIAALEQSVLDLKKEIDNKNQEIINLNQKTINDKKAFESEHNDLLEKSKYYDELHKEINSKVSSTKWDAWDTIRTKISGLFSKTENKNIALEKFRTIYDSLAKSNESNETKATNALQAYNDFLKTSKTELEKKDMTLKTLDLALQKINSENESYKNQTSFLNSTIASLQEELKKIQILNATLEKEINEESYNYKETVYKINKNLYEYKEKFLNITKQLELFQDKEINIKENFFESS